MLRITLLTAPRRIGTFVGAFLAFFCSAVLAVAGGMMLQAALTTHPPVERYAAADVVVTGQQNAGSEHDVPLLERPRVNASLTAKLAAVPGVRAAIADVSVPATINGRTAEAHAWSSARLTPFALSSGRAPVASNEIVTGYPAKLGSHLDYSSTDGRQTATVVGVARARHHVSKPTIFLTDVEAAQLARHPGTVDAIGLITGPGFDTKRVRAQAGTAAVLT